MNIDTKLSQYLARDQLDDSIQKPISASPADFKYPADGTLKMLRVAEVSRPWDRRLRQAAQEQFMTADLLYSAHGMQQPLLFIVSGRRADVAVYLGTFSLDGSHKCSEVATLQSVLQSHYTGLISYSLSKKEIDDLNGLLESHSCAAIVVGTPALKVKDAYSEVSQLDHLIRGMYGTNWAYIVLALPAAEKESANLFEGAMDDWKSLLNALVRTNDPNPIGLEYQRQLKILLTKLRNGKGCGLWHCAVYLLTDEGSLGIARGLLYSTFSGESSKPDPIRVLDSSSSVSGLQKYGIITQQDAGSSVLFRYPYKYISLLNSAELACYVALPVDEKPGYHVRRLAEFDCAPHSKTEGDAIVVGDIIENGRICGEAYKVTLSTLKRHALVAGTTGSGKTHTIFNLASQIWEKKIPFLVIEPAKAEYRKLQKDIAGLQVFTIGDEQDSPFRINPFEIIPGARVQSHIDYLKALFNASFIMYAPMPYVLERCINEIYEDKGWDLVSGENTRDIVNGGGNNREHHPDSQPTLTDLYYKIEEVTNRLGYEERITMDVKAALKTRIDSLRLGAKGMMLDTRFSVKMDEILKQPTVFELEALGDDDEKCFVMGLLLMRMYEYYIVEQKQKKIGAASGAFEPLGHLTVIEEAHRLLKNVPLVQDTEVSNMRGKAVDTFCNMLSEVRAYGKGFIVAEQIPTKLAPDVLKNTGLKIIHLTLAGDDRAVVGAAMNVDPEQERQMGALGLGQAIVFGEGDDTPMLVQVRNKQKDDKVRHEEPGKIADAHNFKRMLPMEFCAEYCESSCMYRRVAQKMLDVAKWKSMMSRAIYSVLLESNMSENVRKEAGRLVSYSARGKRHKNLLVCILLHAVEWYIAEYGRFWEWSFKDASELKKLLLFDVMPKGMSKTNPVDKSSTVVMSTQYKTAGEKYMELCKIGDKNYPFHGCHLVCEDKTCIARFAFMHNTAVLSADFDKAVRFYNRDKLFSRLGKICIDAAAIAVGREMAMRGQVKNRIAKCFGLQKLNQKWLGGPQQRLESTIKKLSGAIDIGLMSAIDTEDNADIVSILGQKKGDTNEQ